MQRTATSFKLKHRSVNAVRQNTTVFRTGDEYVNVLSWGINFMANEIMATEKPSLLLNEHFKAFSKIKVRNHLFAKANLPDKYKFKEYSPQVFRDIRERFGIDTLQLAESVSQAVPERLDTNGRSSSQFFMTSDRRFVIKSLQSDEIDVFHSLLQPYHQYLVEEHAQTLLPHYLGFYRVTIEKNEVYYVVMRSVLPCALPVTELYDLKGSSVDRSAKEKELKDKDKDGRDTPVEVASPSCFKDNDFIAKGRRITLGDERKRTFSDRLRMDVRFLERNKLMDYSLLVGIYTPSADDEAPKEGAPTTSTEATEEQAPPTGVTPAVTQPDPSDVFAIPAAGGKEYYFMGIVDMLTEYNAKKKAAHTAKTMKHGRDAEISTVNPEHYARRLVDFIESAMD